MYLHGRINITYFLTLPTRVIQISWWCGRPYRWCYFGSWIHRTRARPCHWQVLGYCHWRTLGVRRQPRDYRYGRGSKGSYWGCWRLGERKQHEVDEGRASHRWYHHHYCESVQLQGLSGGKFQRWQCRDFCARVQEDLHGMTARITGHRFNTLHVIKTKASLPAVVVFSPGSSQSTRLCTGAGRLWQYLANDWFMFVQQELSSQACGYFITSGWPGGSHNFPPSLCSIVWRSSKPLVFALDVVGYKCTCDKTFHAQSSASDSITLSR